MDRAIFAAGNDMRSGAGRGQSYPANNAVLNANGHAAAPMEESMVCMTVVVEGSEIAFASYNEDRNVIVLEHFLSNGYEVEANVERHVAAIRPNLVLVSNKLVQSTALLELVTRLPPGLPAEEDSASATHGPAPAAPETQARTTTAPGQAQDPSNGTSTNGRRLGAAPRMSSVPYKLLKSSAFDVRSCKTLIVQKLVVLSVIRRSGRAQYRAGDAAGPRNFPLAEGPPSFQVSNYHAMASIVDFDSKVQVQALGALLSHLQNTIFRLEQGGIITVNDIVHANSCMFMNISTETLSALHIFATERHPLVAKSKGNSKEGFSLFSLLDRTKSRAGRSTLREWMAKPLLDPEKIAMRQDGVELFLLPEFSDAAGSMMTLLERVGHIGNILTRMQKCSAKPTDFVMVTKTLCAASAIHKILVNDVQAKLLDMLESQGQALGDAGVDNIPELSRVECYLQFLQGIIGRCDVSMLEDLESRIQAVLDDSATNEVKNKVVIRFGYHERLDELREQYEALEDLMQHETREVVQENPALKQCSALFVPQVGFLISFRKAMVFNDRTGELHGIPEDFDFVFKDDTAVYFKNPRMRELDHQFGDVDGQIKDTERLILEELEDSILGYEPDLRETFDCLAELDCLLSFASCAADLNFVRPVVIETDEVCIEIENGRHPLQEMITEGEFIPNGTFLDATNNVQIITGPNFSGKSCYTRQVGILVYMAHIGSFVPCERARISVTEDIFARISTVETCAVPQSSFQIDLTQMAHIFRRSSPKSLVLIDEFGKGTSPASGIALLTAAMKSLAAAKCTVICTTHFLEVFSLGLLRDGESGIKAFRMAVHVPNSENEDAAPLFKLEEGVASSSAGLVCAENAGVTESVVSRAKEIVAALREGRNFPARPVHRPSLPEATKDALRAFLSVESWKNASGEEILRLKDLARRAGSGP